MIKYTLLGTYGVSIPVQVNRRHLKKLELLTTLARWPNPWLLKLRLWKQNRNAQKSLRDEKKAQKAEREVQSEEGL